MQIVRALAAVAVALVIEPFVEIGGRLVVAMLGVDPLAVLSLLARGLI